MGAARNREYRAMIDEKLPLIDRVIEVAANVAGCVVLGSLFALLIACLSMVHA
jgi:hypothetical protein